MAERQSGLLLAVAVLFGVAAARDAAARPSIRPLDFQPTAVSADGSVVVGDRVEARDQAVRWTAGGGTVVVAEDARARGVSADGRVVVGTLKHFGPFRWTAEGGATRLGHLPGHTAGAANAVSADGNVVVGFSSGAGRTEAFRWTAGGGFIGLGGVERFEGSRASSVSADGSIVVGTSGDRLFRWSAGHGMSDLPRSELEPDLTQWRFSEAIGVSADGNVVVGNSFERIERGDPVDFQTTASVPLLWDARRVREPRVGAYGEDIEGLTGLRRIGDLDAEQENAATAVSADGSVVLGRSWGRRNWAFIWDEAHGMRNLANVLADRGLDLTGWQLGSPTAISADGRTIVGTGTDGSGRSAGWIITIPEPAALPLLGLACLLLGRERGRRRKKQAPERR